MKSYLRPHQTEPVRALLDIFSRHRSAVDLSDCGTGKTFVACAVVKELQTPTLVVCPKIAQTQWKEAAAHFGDEISVVGYELLRTGRTPYGTWANMPDNEDRSFWQCQCCQLRVDLEDPQPCYAHARGIHCVIRRKTAWKYGRFTFHPAVKTVIMDEVQRCGALRSLNADMLIAAKRQGIRILGLSATLAASPLQMRAIGYTLDLFASPAQFPQWAARYGVRYAPEFHGYHWFASEAQQAAIMATIRGSIIPARGVRVTTGEIPGFPEVDIGAELYDLDNADEVARIWAEMDEALQRLKQRELLDADTPLTIQLRAHQRVELLKIPLAIELAEKYEEAGFSIGIFVNFRETLLELKKRLNCDCIIDGSPEGVRHRTRSIEQFQTNASRRILINSQAGGVCLSLQDLHGGHPRGGLVFPGYSANSLKQVFGRFPRDGGKSKSFYRVLLAAKTGDVKIHRALRAKLNNLDALNDADLMPDNLTIAG